MRIITNSPARTTTEDERGFRTRGTRRATASVGQQRARKDTGALGADSKDEHPLCLTSLHPIWVSGELRWPTREIIKESTYSPKKLVPEKGRCHAIFTQIEQLCSFFLNKLFTSTFYFPPLLRGKLY